jgi:hypothetical protein
MRPRLLAAYLFATRALRGRDGCLSFSKLVLAACMAGVAAGRFDTEQAFLFVVASHGVKLLEPLVQRTTLALAAASTSARTVNRTETVTDTTTRQITERRGAATDGTYEATP